MYRAKCYLIKRLNYSLTCPNPIPMYLHSKQIKIPILLLLLYLHIIKRSAVLFLHLLLNLGEAGLELLCCHPLQFVVVKARYQAEGLD